MTELLLNAVINLFALQSALLGSAARAGARQLLADYLRRHLRLGRIDDYVELFEAALDLHAEEDAAELRRRAAEVAARLKPKLPRLEQYVFLLRCLELAQRAGADSAQEEGVISAVSGELQIPAQTLAEARLLCGVESPAGLTAAFLAPDPGHQPPPAPARGLAAPQFAGRFLVWRLAEADALFIRALGDGPLTLDSIPLPEQTCHLLPPGCIIRDGRGRQIYYAEIAAAFSEDGAAAAGRTVFAGRHVDFRYPGSDKGLHDFSFCQRGGQLVGVIGGSGAGKSTLLSILNGQRRPDSGQVLVGDVDLHRQAGRVEGVIGYVPQDDLLFDDLTVFDNLYFAACLCLANLTPLQRRERVLAVLAGLNQADIAGLKVGSPLDKTISGGQRKRLNIALELIREPAILFVDEPTSGLSSADSENVMGLLKAQAALGRLVIAVIHQPSSRIYRLFDAIWVLDQGGRPIFDGNPLDALVYFRRAAGRAGQEEYACSLCGSVNPEQLFEIIEEKVVDEAGRYTRERRIAAAQWHRRHLERQEADPPACPDGGSAPERRLWRPGVWGQLGVFFLRNLKSRLANRMYMLINLLEPPLLAVLAALLCRGAWGGDYGFGDNPNLGIFFFISVIVALFMGLSVGAEEINRDRKILEREKFLNLSWPAYIAAKTLYLALVSAVQMAIFVAVALPILAVPDFALTAWLVLFACSLVSCLVALNISATLKSAVTIYIMIPLLLVPQIMLGGAVVPYDELTWRDADHHRAPLVADLMPSRWGYEALVMAQFTGNRFHGQFFADDCAVRQADYLTDRYITELRGLADFPFLGEEGPAVAAKTARALRILGHELPRLAARTGQAAPAVLDRPTPGAYDRADQTEVKDFLDQAEAAVQAGRQAAAQRLDDRENALVAALGRDGFERLRRENHNRELAKLALDQQALEDLRLGRNRVVQLTLPACREPESRRGDAHFLAAAKRLGPWRIPTPAFDLGVLGVMALLLYALLYFAVLPRISDGLAGLADGLRRRRARES
ncbi:MAG: ATP-binding cassette domain-containing protein [Pseudomonadota bacterium]